MEKQLYVDEEKFKKIIKLLATAMQSLSENQALILKAIIDASPDLSASEKLDLAAKMEFATKTLKLALQLLNDQLLS